MRADTDVPNPDAMSRPIDGSRAAKTGKAKTWTNVRLRPRRSQPARGRAEGRYHPIRRIRPRRLGGGGLPLQSSLRADDRSLTMRRLASTFASPLSIDCLNEHV